MEGVDLYLFGLSSFSKKLFVEQNHRPLRGLLVLTDAKLVSITAPESELIDDGELSTFDDPLPEFLPLESETVFDDIPEPQVTIISEEEEPPIARFLQINSVDPKIDEEDLREEIEAFGDIEEFRWNKQLRRCCVALPTAEEAKFAEEKLDGLRMGRFMIRVKVTTSMNEDTVENGQQRQRQRDRLPYSRNSRLRPNFKKRIQ